MRFGALAVAVALTLLGTGCGDPDSAANGKAPAELDRSNLESVAEASMTAFVTKDYDTLEPLLVPEQRQSLDALETVAEASGEDSVVIRVESISATVLTSVDGTASVEFDGEYCTTEPETDVSITTEAPAEPAPDEGLPPTTLAAGEESCLDFATVFGPDSFVGAAEFRLVDGDWYAAFLS